LADKVKIIEKNNKIQKRVKSKDVAPGPANISDIKRSKSKDK
jgi:hypothetical protein